MHKLYIPKGLKLVEVHPKGLGVIATKFFRKGTIVSKLLYDSIVPREGKGKYYLQIWEDCFANNGVRLNTIDNYLNHSCDPNTIVNVPRSNFTAIKDIPPGKEITWNYLTTEYDLSKDGEDFLCQCGAENCIGVIEGFKYLTEDQKRELRPYLSTYLRVKLFQDSPDVSLKTKKICAELLAPLF